MKLKRVNFACFVFLLCVQSSFAQTTNPNTNPPVDPRDPRPEYMRRVDDARKRQADNNQKIIDQLGSSTKGGYILRKPETSEERKAREQENKEILEEINALLAAPPEYFAKYSEFLKKKNTGIARIFPDRGCDKGKTVSLQELERCGGTAQIRGAGSIYSFRLNEIPNNLPLELIRAFVAQSDIHFINGKVEVGTGGILDIIAEVGDVELSTVDLRSDSVRYLRAFKPGKTDEKVAVQRKQIVAGVNENGYFYSTSSPVVLNRTYVLRSIAFDRFGFRSFWNTDVITAFKVIGLEKDGSVVILWKELKETSAPYLHPKK